LARKTFGEGFGLAEAACTCYNVPGVVSVTARVERLFREIEGLSQDELRELLQRLADRVELLGWLKLAEPVFADWDNPEDEVYDRL
jgi:hypothetical protein